MMMSILSGAVQSDTASTHTQQSDEIKTEKTGLSLTSKVSEKSIDKGKDDTDNKEHTVKENPSNTKHNEQRNEPVSGVHYDGQTLRFTVISNGCTRPEHFSVAHSIVDNQCQISIERTQPDFCRRVPFPAEISLSWQLPDECQSMDIRVQNPLLTGTGHKLQTPPTDKNQESDTQ